MKIPLQLLVLPFALLPSPQFIRANQDPLISTPRPATRTLLIPLSEVGFDASEASVPWSYLRDAGVRVIFATRNGEPARVDPLINEPRNFPLLFRKSLATNADGMRAYRRMIASPEFKQPIRWSDIPEIEPALDAIYIPGGHYAGEYGTGSGTVRDGTTGIRQLIESEDLQKLAGRMHAEGKLVAAICHGVLLLGRAIDPRTGRSIVEGRSITALPRLSEEFAIAVTRKTLGRYYRTYDITVQDELTQRVGPKGRFAAGPATLVKDGPDSLEFGFVMEDGNLVTGRWQGDAHLMGHVLARRLRIPATDIPSTTALRSTSESSTPLDEGRDLGHVRTVPTLRELIARFAERRAYEELIPAGARDVAEQFQDWVALAGENLNPATRASLPARKAWTKLSFASCILDEIMIFKNVELRTRYRPELEVGDLRGLVERVFAKTHSESRTSPPDDIGPLLHFGCGGMRQ